MSPQLLSITRQLAMLPWRDRLALLWQVLCSFLPMSDHALKRTRSNLSELATALNELQQICTEENYTLDIPGRMNRVNPFGDP